MLGRSLQSVWRSGAHLDCVFKGRGIRLLLVIAAIPALALALVAAARADTPATAPVVVGHFDNVYEYSDTSMCTFSVDVVVHDQGSFRFFPTDQGHGGTNVFHDSVTESFSANGKTVLVRGDFTDTFFFPDLMTEHGLSVQIRLAGGGLVIEDAGLFVVQFPDGTITLVRGPHPLQPLNESAAVAAICAQLAP
jgi:hypothetical protein